MKKGRGSQRNTSSTLLFRAHSQTECSTKDKNGGLVSAVKKKESTPTKLKIVNVFMCFIIIIIEGFSFVLIFRELNQYGGRGEGVACTAGDVARSRTVIT